MSTPASLSVLIVDDHRDGANSMAELLSLHGHSVRVAYTAADGVAMAGARTPDVAILDIGLPDGNGFDLAEAFSALAPRPLIVTLTGYPNQEPRSQAVGSDHHVVKTTDPNWIVGLLAEYGRTLRRG